MIQHLNQYQLAKRWTISQRTLERWRYKKEGPHYLKVGGRVVYRLVDIEAYEDEAIRYMNTEPQQPVNRQSGPYR